MLFGILLTIQIIICVSMGGLILIQRSEGGALGMGGGPSGFMSARGAGNLLTRMTGILAVLFFSNCIGLTIAGNYESRATAATALDKVDTSGLTLGKSTLPAAPAAAAASSTSSAPSLSDLPLATTPSLVPASSSAAPVAAPKASPSGAAVSMPPPVKLPAASSSSSLTQKQIDAAKANIFNTASSSSKAPASSSSASKTANAPAAPVSSSSSSAPH